VLVWEGEGGKARGRAKGLSGFQLQAAGKLLTWTSNRSAFLMQKIYSQDMQNISSFIKNAAPTAGGI